MITKIIWIDKDTFAIDGKLAIYNYNNFISVSVVSSTMGDTSETVMKIQGRMLDGKPLVFAEFLVADKKEVNQFKSQFEDFMLNRPSESKNKIKIG